MTVKDANIAAAGSNTTQSFTVSIDKVDSQAPLITSVGKVVVESSSATVGAAIYQVAGSDDTAISRWSLKTTGDYSAFNLNNGALSFKATPNKSSYVVTLVAEDAAGNRTEKDVVIDLWSPEQGPRLLSASPADDATRVALNSDIVFTFNEAIQRGNGAIKLKTLSGTEVAATTAISGNTLTLNPSTQLNNDTMYVVELAAGAVKDTSGSDYASAAVSSYNFKTIAGIDGVTTGSNDTTGPGLASSSATGVAIDAPFQFAFNEAIQRGSGSILLKQGATIVETIDIASSQISISADHMSLWIDPSALLNKNTTYSLELAKGVVRDAAGNDTEAASFSVTTANSGAFDIQVDYTDGSLDSLSDSEMTAVQHAVEAAVATWENVIVGDLPNVGNVDDYHLLVKIDSKLDVLGTGGFTQLRTAVEGGLPWDGTITLNMNNFNNQTLFDLMTTHEVGHALGAGTLWGKLGLNSVFGQYTGSKALQVWQSMKNDTSLGYVPLEVDGGSGTANAHWSENIFGNELMTGYQDISNPEKLSSLTIAMMADLGYVVDMSAANSTYQLATASLAPTVDASYAVNGPGLQQGYYVV